MQWQQWCQTTFILAYLGMLKARYEGHQILERKPSQHSQVRLLRRSLKPTIRLGYLHIAAPVQEYLPEPDLVVNLAFCRAVFCVF